MPFLVPALISLCSDAITLWLAGHPPNHNETRGSGSSGGGGAGENDDHDDEGRYIYYYYYYNVGYLSYLALIRVILLLLPLLWHSYTGTGLRCLAMYQLLYWGTLVTILLQMLALCLLNPTTSLQALIPVEIDASSSSSSLNDPTVLQQLRRIWWMLTLSLLSDICHLILLNHVRSTAPHHSLLYGRHGRKRQQPYSMYYYAAARQQQQSQQRTNGAVVGDFTDTTEPDLMHAMTDFVDDVQARWQKTKSDWAARLDDFTNRISHREQQQQHERHSSTTSTTTAATRSSLPKLTPFRVLLHLFAYEDVLNNGELDHVFDVDDGTSMTFFVPQLLSFLLHGALFSSPKLEEWILTQCRRNIHFAHRCYWFLRAWCLEVPLVAVSSSSLSRSNSESHLLAAAADNNTMNTSSSNTSIGGAGAGGGLAPFLDEPAASTVSPQDKLLAGYCGGGGGSSSLRKSELLLQQQAAAEKFLPEERAMIERLMLRIKECGEEAARILEYGGGPPPKSEAAEEDETTSSDVIVSRKGHHHHHYEADNDNNFNNGSSEETRSRRTQNGSGRMIMDGNRNNGNTNSSLVVSPSDLMSLAESGCLPVDPGTGFPSVRHLDSVSARRKFGFLPLLPEEEGGGGGESSSAALHRADDDNDDAVGHSETEHFDRTPHFLDALIFLADTLHQVPKEKRKDELRKQLRMLECELLPSNAIYVPIGNVHHRVWRIVADESIVISTKERVPCIVCLEVVDYTPKRRKPRAWSFLDRLPMRPQRAVLPISSETLEVPPPPKNDRRTSSQGIELADLAANESELVSEWRYGYRDPLRRCSIFDKMTLPLDKMTTQVRDKLSSFRDRSSNEELRSLTQAQVPIEEEFHEEGSTVSDVERGAATYPAQMPLEDNNKSEVPGMSRIGSAGSLVSMGQWSSPYSRDRTIIRPPGLPENLIRRFEERETDRQSESSLPYGSDHEEDRSYESSSPPKARRSIGSTGVGSSTRPPPVMFRESWQNKQERLRSKSAYGSHPEWRLLPVLIKANDDLRQEQLASQLIYRMAAILAREKVPVWLCPYEIIALTDSGGIIEAIPDTISLDSLKRNDRNFTSLNDFFISHFGEGTEELADAQANFVESLAAYSIVSFLLQLKDRHNGNILLDNRGHLIHIDFGFFFLSSPGKNAGFESAPFKLTRDFVEVLGGPNSRLFRTFRELCIKTFITLRRHCMEIILMVEMLKTGNEELNCFRGRPDEAIQQLRQRFQLQLNDRACREYVNSLIDNSIENWRTDWYDRYQRYFVGVL